MHADVLPPRVLCVEDDAATATLIARHLERRGYIIEVVGTGAEALTRLTNDEWGAVLIDQRLPDIAGLDVLETMTQRGALPATVMVTGRGNESVAAAALKLGAHDYIVKDASENYLDLLPEIVDKARRLVQQRDDMARITADRERLVAELTEALARVRTLSGLIPICAGCKSIRNERGDWEAFEAYLAAHSEALLSHSFCPACLARHYPDFPPGH